MKKCLFYIGLVTLCLFNSCAVPKQSVVNISGTPGTHIYESPIREKPLGVIPQSGTLALTLDNKLGVWDVLFAHDSIRNVMIPFALNYTKKNYGSDAIFWTGMGMGACGISITSGGLVMTILSGLGGLAMLIPGLALTSAGWSMFGVENKRQKEYPIYTENFDYLPNQVTNQDLELKMPEYEYEPRVSPIKSNEQEVRDDMAKAEVSTIKLRDNTKTIIGTYNGTCTISQDGDEIDQIADIQLQLTRINSTTVSGVLLDTHGKELLGKASEFQVRKRDGHFILTNKEKEDVTIDIDSNGKLIYNNPSVMIEDAIYQIQVQANKK